VVVAALAKFGDGDVQRPRGEVRLPPDLAASVVALATTSGRSSDEIVADAVRRYVQEPQRASVPASSPEESGPESVTGAS
jgi:hypothetical protein